MIIGQFLYNTETKAYTGHILTLGIQLMEVEITPTNGKSEKEPDYRVTAQCVFGHVELGAAWKRVSDRGLDFISVSLDAPTFATPVNAALFTDGGDASLVWSRQKKAAEKGAA